MKTILASLAAAIAFLLPMAQTAAADATPQNGVVLPVLLLPVPEDPSHKAYLGLGGEGTFRITEIRGSIVIIQILSMYCPHCQREAPRINAFYDKMENNPALRGKVKIIGIGVGNTSFEMAFFRKKYGVPFPLFSDPDFVVHQRIGEVRTPYFIGVRLAEPDAGRVFYSRLGGADDAVSFLEELLQAAGL